MLHFPFSDFLASISTCQSKAENELIHPNWDISHTLQILSIRIVDVFLKSNHNSLSICVILVHTYTLATSLLYVRSVHKRGPFRIRVGKNWRALKLRRKKSLNQYRSGQPNWNFWLDIPQSWNLAIFLPFWFYVKSILDDFMRFKIAIVTILKALNLIFRKIPKFQNSELLKWSKWQFLTFWNHQKLISRKIRMARKFLPFYTVFVWQNMI